MSGVTTAYNEVHQIYHIALAAHEAGCLDRFYCSVIDTPGAWGGRLSRLLGSEAMVSRRRSEIPIAKVVERPWPLLEHRLRVRARLRAPQDWGLSNDKFDKWVARRLRNSPSRVFVGVETCARDSLAVARRRGMATVLDCHQAHPAFLEELLARAADDLKMSAPGPIDTPEMAARKRDEFAEADYLLMLSEVEWRSYQEQGVDPTRLVLTPLWADPRLWFPPPTEHFTQDRGVRGQEPLQVLFVGSIGLRKGIPYLLRAARAGGKYLQLTLVGPNSGEVAAALREHEGEFVYVPPQSKAHLREMYWEADVLVLPSLVETFGFVAMEAMACGTPVVVSCNCGVPVPDESWRVPIMNAEAIVERLLLYARDRERCREDGRRAATFSRQWTPERYRAQISSLLLHLLR